MDIQAVKYIGQIGIGSSQPHLFECEDGKKYVVKFMSNPQGIKILSNELIAYRLGRLLDLPVADSAVINISRNIIKEYEELEKIHVKDGPHFGSLYIENTGKYPSSRDYLICSNIDKIPSIIVFDHWINNYDRCNTRSNLLVAKGDQCKLVMIDHASCFYFLDSPVKVYWGEVYKTFVNSFNQEDPFYVGLSAIETLSFSQLLQATVDIPEQWHVTEKQIKSLIQQLIKRTPHIGEALDQLRPYFSKR